MLMTDDQKHDYKAIDAVVNIWTKEALSPIPISEPTRRYAISYAVFCLKKNTASSLTLTRSPVPFRSVFSLPSI